MIKFKNGNHFNFSSYLHLDLPEKIKQQVKLGLPLIDKQIRIIQRIVEKIEEEKKKKNARKEVKNIINNLIEKQKDITTLEDKINDLNSHNVKNTNQNNTRKIELVTSKLTEDDYINYEALLEKYLDILEKIRNKEKRIPEVLIRDWKTIQHILSDAKHNKPINYRQFLLLLSNLLTSIGIYEDIYK